MPEFKMERRFTRFPIAFLLHARLHIRPAHPSEGEWETLAMAGSRSTSPWRCSPSRPWRSPFPHRLDGSRCSGRSPGGILRIGGSGGG